MTTQAEGEVLHALTDPLVLHELLITHRSLITETRAESLARITCRAEVMEEESSSRVPRRCLHQQPQG
ncbi:uncharacterized protein V6R79_003576 [Siganus canaliculatus]